MSRETERSKSERERHIGRGRETDRIERDREKGNLLLCERFDRMDLTCPISPARVTVV